MQINFKGQITNSRLEFKQWKFQSFQCCLFNSPGFSLLNDFRGSRKKKKLAKQLSCIQLTFVRGHLVLSALEVYAIFFLSKLSKSKLADFNQRIVKLASASYPFPRDIGIWQALRVFYLHSTTIMTYTNAEKNNSLQFVSHCFLGFFWFLFLINMVFCCTPCIVLLTDVYSSHPITQ